MPLFFAVLVQVALLIGWYTVEAMAVLSVWIIFIPAIVTCVFIAFMLLVVFIVMHILN